MNQIGQVSQVRQEEPEKKIWANKDRLKNEKERKREREKGEKERGERKWRKRDKQTNYNYLGNFPSKPLLNLEPP